MGDGWWAWGMPVLHRAYAGTLADSQAGVGVGVGVRPSLADLASLEDGRYLTAEGKAVRLAISCHVPSRDRDRSFCTWPVHQLDLQAENQRDQYFLPLLFSSFSSPFLLLFFSSIFSLFPFIFSFPGPLF